jgi:hypothetical protein
MSAIRHGSWSSAAQREPTADLLLQRHGGTPRTGQDARGGHGDRVITVTNAPATTWADRPLPDGAPPATAATNPGFRHRPQRD